MRLSFPRAAGGVAGSRHLLAANGKTILVDCGMFQGGQRDYSECTAREIDLAVRALVGEAYDRAKSVLCDHRADLDAGAALLLIGESLTPDNFPPIHPPKAPRKWRHRRRLRPMGEGPARLVVLPHP